MSSLLVLAEFVQSSALNELPEERRDRVRSHLIDTLGAMKAGLRLKEGISAGKFAAHDGSRHAAIAAACAAARCTEVDDIHLSSCTTPGSVVIPVALALAASRDLRTWKEFLAAVTAGYEVMIRIGYAINGPAILGKKVWPTFFAASLGAAAVASRVFQLDIRQTASALATALTFSAGTAAPARSEESSRWLSLGVAAANGVMAASAARSGIAGPEDLLERYAARIAGVSISRKRLLQNLGDTFLFDEIGMKPYPIARQALAAVEGVREMMTHERIKAPDLEKIVIGVPDAQRWVIDHPELPSTRMESIVSVQYQIALQIVAPEGRLAISGGRPFLNDAMRTVMAKILVKHAPDLEKYYPAAWPAKVEIRAKGRRFRGEVLHPHGDAKDPLDWSECSVKFIALGGPAAVIEQVRDLKPKGVMPRLWEALHS